MGASLDERNRVYVKVPADIMKQGGTQLTGFLASHRKLEVVRGKVIEQLATGAPEPKHGSIATFEKFLEAQQKLFLAQREKISQALERVEAQKKELAKTRADESANMSQKVGMMKTRHDGEERKREEVRHELEDMMASADERRMAINKAKLGVQHERAAIKHNFLRTQLEKSRRMQQQVTG